MLAHVMLVAQPVIWILGAASVSIEQQGSKLLYAFSTPENQAFTNTCNETEPAHVGSEIRVCKERELAHAKSAGRLG